ncbi:MAG: AsmA family protein [Xanthobacteraceae bacterium]|uniref:AsmA family protein n=1 Tax=Pseudolabrys sp. TaxID=1960880 RepID=UPI003D0AA4F1
MTVATGFKRLGLTLAFAFILGGGILMALNHLVSTDAVRDKVQSEIRSVTGFEPEIRGVGTVSLFPSGTVSFADVRMGQSGPAQGGEPALTAERLVAHLKFFPLLIGRAEIDDVTLERPRIALHVSADGHSNWSNLLERLESGQKAGSEETPLFSEIRIQGGTIIFRDMKRGIDERLDDVEMSLAWPQISKSFGATGRFRWHGQMMDGSLTMSDFAAALAGNQSGLKFRIAGTTAKAAFDGNFSMKPTLKVDGTLAADAANLRDTMVWAGRKPLPGGGFERFALKAQANVVGGTIALSNVNVELDGNKAEGVLTFATDGRQTLQGTLAADKIDLSPYVATVRLLATSQREWNNAPLSLDGLAAFDVDLRLSAANVVLPGATLGRTAIGANLRGGHLSVAIGESQAFNGVIKGSFTISNFETGVDLKSQMQFMGVDLSACLGQLLGMHRLEGKGNVVLALEGSGDSILALTRTLTGSASVNGEKGSLLGLNVEQLLRRLERSPLSGGGDFRAGRTPYDKLTVVLRIAKGVATISDARVSGPSVQLALTGSALIPTRELSLKGTAGLLTGAGSEKTPKFELPFFVEGSWDDPIMLPDPQILIRRSGAAAPLLDAVRDKKARDAVRSAIKQITGGSPRPDSAPAATADGNATAAQETPNAAAAGAPTAIATPAAETQTAPAQ